MRVERVGLVLMRYADDAMRVAVFYTHEGYPRLCNAHRSGSHQAAIGANELKDVADGWKVQGFDAGSVIPHLELADMVRDEHRGTVYRVVVQPDVRLPETAEWVKCDELLNIRWRSPLFPLVRKVALLAMSMERHYATRGRSPAVQLSELARSIAHNAKLYHLLFAVAVRAYMSDAPDVADWFAAHEHSHLLDDNRTLTQQVNKVLEVAKTQQSCLALIRGPSMLDSTALFNCVETAVQNHYQAFGAPCLPFEAAAWRELAARLAQPPVSIPFQNLPPPQE